MRFKVTIPRGVLAAALACATPIAVAQVPPEGGNAPADPHAAHHAAAHHDTASADAPATPYASDAPLREAMASIARAHDSWRAADPRTGTALAQTIDDAIASMIANCRLPPDADAALHGIIGRLGRDAAALRQRPGDPATHASIDAALADYHRLFRDGGG